MKSSLIKQTVIAASLVPAGLSTPALAQSSPGALEEIIVSAQRRQQSLQDVPISISAFSNSAIETYRIENLTDLGKLVPNLSAVEGAGGTRSILFQIRGLYASGTALGADSGVATYLDGVYMKGGNGSIVSYADIERIEVLRGPQGTLFGRNTSGGAINFITRDPVGEFGFRQKLTTGNLNLFESSTRIDSPQWGPVSASLNYTYTERDGPVDNSGAGFTADMSQLGGGTFVSPRRLGDLEQEALFLALAFDLHEDLNLVYKYDYTDADTTPTAVGILGAGPSLAALTGPSAGVEMPDSVNNAFHMPSHQVNQGHNLTAEFALSDTITLRNILAYREGTIDVPGQTLDGLGMFAPIVVVFTVTGGSVREETSEEFQVIWDTDQFTLTSGLMYYGLEQSAGGYNHVQNGFFGAAPPNLTFFPGTMRATQSEVEVDSMAVYSQLEYRLTDAWDLILGGRYTKDEKDYIDRTLMTNEVLNTTYDENEGTYLLGANYKPTDDILIYSKYSTGYISGGIVSGVAYEPEKAQSLEIGAKATWFEGRLQTNLAWFSVDYEDQQFGTAGNLVDPPVPASQVLVNAGETEAQGFELEASWLPVRGATLGLNLGYLDFDFVDVDLVLIGGEISEHLRPQWSGTLSADYVTDPLFADASLRFHLDASYRASEWVVTRPADFVDDGRNPDTWRLNAQLSLQDLSVGDGKVTVALWGRNLTDENLPANMNTLGPIISGTYEFPRTYGIDLTYEY